MICIKTKIKEMPEYCDDCNYYGCRPHPDKGWIDLCELMCECMSDESNPDWIYDGNGRPKKCPLIEINLEIYKKSRNNEWVDVSDRLPSERGVYLVTVDYSPPSIQVYEVSYGYSRELEKECFYDYDDGWGEREVTDVIAWKPLPKPYERKENK